MAYRTPLHRRGPMERGAVAQGHGHVSTAFTDSGAQASASSPESGALYEPQHTFDIHGP